VGGEELDCSFLGAQLSRTSQQEHLGRRKKEDGRRKKNRPRFLETEKPNCMQKAVKTDLGFLDLLVQVTRPLQSRSCQVREIMALVPAKQSKVLLGVSTGISALAI